MKSRDIFLPSISAVLVGGLIIFQSCAHQNRSAEDMDSMDEATYSDSGSQSNSTAQASESGDLGGDANAPTEAESNSLAGPLAEKSSDSLGGDSSTDSLEKELESSNSGVENQKDPQIANSKNAASSDELSLENELEGTGPSSSGTAEASAAAGAALGSSLESELESVEPVQPKTDELAAQKTIAPEVEPLSQETLKLKSKPKHSTYRASNRVPKIPAKAISRKGTKLNRFYFVRQGDTPKSVSTLIYGSPKKANLLTKWNGKSWSPGKLVYYASAESPKDSKMDSFYKENGVQAEEYAVAQGDWLSKIAKNKLGSPKSWTEIAVVNGISSPKALEVGQKIAIYPKDLTSKPQETMFAKSEPVAQPIVEQKVIQPPPVVEPPPVEAKPEPPVAAVAPKSNPVSSESKGFNANNFIEQNMFSGLMLLAGVLLLALLMVKKRQKARVSAQQDDFADGDEGFQAPTKLKRK